MDKLELLQGIIDSGVVAIVRLSSPGNLMQVAEAIAEGGVRHIEFTMTTPGALQIVAEASQRFGDDIIMGAGTVLDAETARAAILAGARFIVAPNFDPAVIEMCNRYSVVSMPGALTPTEILHAWECGADVVKIFPADQFGPGYIKAVMAPLPQVRLAPVGGVSADNIADYMRAGASCAGIGSSLVNSQRIADKDWAALTARAKELVEGVQAGRS